VRVIPDLDLGAGLVATQIVDPADLLAEGAPGPDAHGAAGLDHCVASYATDVAAGNSLILSVRRTGPGGYERVSTAELRPDRRAGEVDVVQHRARGNADPDPAVEAALESALERLAGGIDLSALPPPGAAPFDPAPHLADPGAWERMRDAWAFALPRPLRRAGPAGILAAAGLLPLRGASGGAIIGGQRNPTDPAPAMTKL
jgi:hypothetical protein